VANNNRGRRTRESMRLRILEQRGTEDNLLGPPRTNRRKDRGRCAGKKKKGRGNHKRTRVGSDLDAKEVRREKERSQQKNQGGLTRELGKGQARQKSWRKRHPAWWIRKSKRPDISRGQVVAWKKRKSGRAVSEGRRGTASRGRDKC